MKGELIELEAEARRAGRWEAARYLAAQGELCAWEHADRLMLASERAMRYTARLGYGPGRGGALRKAFAGGFLAVAAFLLGEGCGCKGGKHA